MKKSKIFLILATTVLLLAGHVFGACEWFRSVTRPRAWVEVCAEQLPDANADPNGFTAYEPAEFSTTRCRIGDTLAFKFTVGRNADSDGLGYGHLTRQDARCGGVKNLNSTDPGAISYYMFPNTGQECWRGMLFYPGNEEGFIFNSPSVRDKIGFDGSRNNLITLRMVSMMNITWKNSRCGSSFRSTIRPPRCITVSMPAPAPSGRTQTSNHP
ncbi:MAG: hypothetical protein GF350_00570 [Chitinivibrionales bacterium]|nr:hypothetical protein [Chitinivibrionales bacterium]